MCDFDECRVSVEKTVTARKSRACSGCGTGVVVGQRYLRISGIDAEQRAFRYGFCAECEADLAAIKDASECRAASFDNIWQQLVDLDLRVRTDAFARRRTAALMTRKEKV